LNKLSFTTRKETLEKLTSETLDVLIIGGGITGAGLALQAGAQDLKAGLLEMQDFAAGTSSRSTKLVHGGLRYLKQFEVEMVADITKEREVIYQNAPHIVQPEKMLLPVYDEPGASFTDFSAKVALDLYDRLAEVDEEDAHHFISKEEVLKDIPSLKEEGLLKGGLYLDYINDDARLTLEILKKASDLGTFLMNYMKVTDFLYDENDQIIGVQAKDTVTDESYEIQAKTVVNATGPWSDEIRNKQKDEDADRMYPTKGVHFVVDSRKLPVKHTVYTDTGLEDDRMIFIIPRGDKTYFGTTDTPYEGNFSEPGITKEDLDYLLKAINNRFPEADLSLSDIEAGWSGLRPLILEEDATDASSISRTHDVFVSDAGLITIAGGKLTDYRLMAQDTFEMILSELTDKTGKTYERVETKNISLSGGDIPNYLKFEDYVQDNIEKGVEIGLTEVQAKDILEWYGSNAETVFSLKEEAESINLPLDIALSLVYALEYEAVMTPVDFFLRRTDMLLFSTNEIENWITPVIDTMEQYFGWSAGEKTTHVEELNKTISNVQLKSLKG
jgi:glycerol-3-phosphate dehydrogenase